MPNRTMEALDEERITFTPSGGMAATDLICGMEVGTNDDRTRRSEYAGKTYYFCSEGCKNLFDGDPTEFAIAPRSESP